MKRSIWTTPKQPLIGKNESWKSKIVVFSQVWPSCMLPEVGDRLMLEDIVGHDLEVST